MRSKLRRRAVARAAALLLPAALISFAGLSPACAGGFGGGGFGGGPAGGPVAAPMGRPGIGPGAYAPGQGPVGSAAWNGGNWRGYTPAYGFWGGGNYGGGNDGGAAVARGGGGANVFTYNHFDNRRRDGGFYGGGGAFYADDGYSRLTPPVERADHDAGPRQNPHIIYLPDVPSRAPRVSGAHQARH